jgi:4-amino-4-deoxy-L-arabinose transferase-like glycosyltransferase
MVRLPAALAGILTILAIFLLGREILGDLGGLLAAFLLAVSPWHLLLTRWANQASILPLFLCLAVYACLRYYPLSSEGPNTPFPKGGGRNLRGVLSGLFFFLTLFTYAPARVFVPLFLIALTVLFLRSGESNGRWRFPSAVWLGFLALAIPFGFLLFLSWGETTRRFGAVSIFSGDPGLTATVQVFVTGYLKHLDPRYLFLSGDANLRHSVPGWGQMYHVEVCTVLLGLLVAVIRRRRRDLLLLAWLLTALIPPALTGEGIPHALRSVAALPALVLLSASGFLALFDLMRPDGGKSRWTLLPTLTLGLALLLQASGFVAGLFIRYPLEAYPYWQYGYRKAVQEIQDLRRPGETVFVSALSAYPKVFFLFYGKVSPAAYQKGNPLQDTEFLEVPLVGAGAPAPEPGLLLLRPGESVSGENLVTIPGPDGQPIWFLFRVPPPRP